MLDVDVTLFSALLTRFTSITWSIGVVVNQWEFFQEFLQKTIQSRKLTAGASQKNGGEFVQEFLYTVYFFNYCNFLMSMLVFGGVEIHDIRSFWRIPIITGKNPWMSHKSWCFHFPILTLWGTLVVHLESWQFIIHALRVFHKGQQFLWIGTIVLGPEFSLAFNLSPFDIPMRVDISIHSILSISDSNPFTKDQAGLKFKRCN